MGFQELDDFLSQPGHREDIISEGVMPVRSRVVVAGPPKIRKTTLITQMALELASGTPFLGLFDIPKPTACILAELEIDEDSYRERLALARQTIYNIQPGFLFIGGPQPLLIDTPQGSSQLVSEITSKQPKVVILDPLYNLHTKNEDKASEIKPVLMFLDKLVREYSVSFVLIHHTSKGRTDNKGRRVDLGMDSIRGSNALYGWADSVLLMDEVPGQDNIILRFWLRHGAIDPVVLTLVKDTFTFTAQPQGQPTTVHEQAVSALLKSARNRKMEYQSLIAGIRTKTNSSERTAQRAIASMKKKALIAETGEGRARRTVYLLAPPKDQWFLLE